MTKVEGGGVPAGTQLNGIYEIEQRIAIGGMGEVYSGRVIQTGDKVAIKMILPEHANNQIILDLFRREASTLHNLYHEAIVRYYVFSVDPELNRPYLSMEFAAGPSLGERVQQGGPLAEAEMTVLRRRIAGGLQAAHRLGIVHRDISPDNIILVDGEMEHAKIIDFGIARSTANEGTLIGSGFAGKLNYVSPEQLGLEGGEVTGKSDIYSLGLVFAEAAIGHPLPMGGSQVEVIEKRRTVPDLSPIPAWIRPLIERMVQPDPADRPADMQAIADWAPAGPEPTTINLAGRASRPPSLQSAPRAEPPQKAGRRGPWLWMGLGSTGLAAAAVAGFVLLGGEDEDHSPSMTGAVTEGDILSPVSESSGDTLLAPGGTARITPPAESASLPGAEMGERYSWTSDRFDYEGDRAGLSFITDGKLPLGVSLHASDGAARLSGTPVEPGDFAFDIVARTPEGDAARMRISLVVADAAGSLDGPAEPALDLAAEADAGGLPESLTPAAPTRAETAPQLLEPKIASTVPDAQAPAAEESLGGLAAGGVGLAPAKGSSAPALVPGGGADALPKLPAPDREPVAAAGDVDQGQEDGPDTAQGDAGSGEMLARIPPPDNLPPQIVTSRSEPVAAMSGEQINADLAAYTDEEGPGALDLHIDGDLPEGLRVELSESGVAELRGRPTEFGEYSFRVATIDPHGLVSQPIIINLVIAPPSAEQQIRNYILGYRGGDCFLSRPVELGPQLARVEVFASEDRIQSVIDFDAAFKRAMGFEADIGMRPISRAQCPLIQTLDAMPAGTIDGSLIIDLDRDEITSGEVLSGRIRGGEGARLFLHDDEGGQTDLSPYMHTANGEAGFAVPITASGPQLLIAARPIGEASLDHVTGLGGLLDLAGQGEAALAVGFFLMN